MTIGIIGTGWGARIQVPAFRAAGLKVTALVGQDQTKTEQIASALEVDAALTDWRALLSREDVQLVSIVTPPHLHSEMSIAALEAGKHVLCEKPTAMDRHEAQQMSDAAAAHPDLLALIDHEMRFAPVMQHAKQRIADGLIGAVRYAHFVLMGSSRAGLARPWNWWSDASQGGGLLGAVASHQIDLLRFMLNAEVASVSALLNTFVRERNSPDGLKPVTSDDYYSLRLNFQNETLATLENNSTTGIDEPQSVTIFGENGTLRWLGGSGGLLYAAAGQPFQDITPPHVYEAPAGLTGDFPHATIYLGHALRAYFEGDHAPINPAATFVDGLQIQAVLDAARRSDAKKGVITAV